MTTENVPQKQNVAMRQSVVLMATTMLIAAAAAFPTPAAATDTKTAIVLCDKNPNCNMSPLDKGGVTMVVNNKDGLGDIVIWCPGTGPGDCIRLIRPPGGSGTLVGSALTGGQRPTTVAPVAPTPLSPRQQQLQLQIAPTAPAVRYRGVEGEPATPAPAEQKDTTPAPK